MTASTNRTTGTDEDEARPRLDLSVPKIAAGALASVTTAVAASFFGVTGTLAGAAFGSVLSSIAAAVYTTSFQTAGTRIRATRTLVPRSRRTDGGDDPQDPTSMPPGLTGRSVPLPGDTTVMPSSGPPGPRNGWQGNAQGADWPAQPYGGWQQPGAPVPPQHRPRQERRGLGLWQPAAVMAGVIFVAAMGVIFGTELVIGHPISNSQQTGTSVSQIIDPGDSKPSKRDRKEAPATTTSTSSSESESPSPSDSSSAEPTGTSSTSDSTTTSESRESDGPGRDSQTSGDQSPSGQNSGDSGDSGGQERTTGDGAAPPPSGAGENTGGDRNGQGDTGAPTGAPGA